jgi:hypothetical protein
MADNNDPDFTPLNTSVANNDPDFTPLNTPANTTPLGIGDVAKNMGKTALNKTLKIFDAARGLSGGPLFGEAIEKMTGKPVYSSQDVANAVNPMSTDRFPSATEMMTRAGIPAGAKLSDYLGGYSEPGNAPWYKPEKGGMLDPSVRGTIGTGLDIATDPVTYATLGAAGAARAASKADIVAQALKEPATSMVGKVAERAGGAVDSALSPLATAAEKASSTSVGNKVAQAASVASPSQNIGRLGKVLYNSTLLPIEAEGTKLGKSGVGDNFYKAGAWNSIQLPDVADAASSKLSNATQGMEQAAEAAGKRGNPATIIAPLENQRNAWANMIEPEPQALAKQAQGRIDNIVQKTSDIPATPATTRPVQTGVNDYMDPIMGTETVSGQPAIPGRQLTPTELRQQKTFIGNNIARNQRMVVANPNVNTDLEKAAESGYRNAAAETMGDQADKYNTLNQANGTFLSTGRSQQAVAAQGNRLLHDIPPTSGMSKLVIGAEGAKGGMWNAAMNAARFGTMPAGYGMRKFGESTVAAPLLDSYLQRKAINSWSDPQLRNGDGDNGKN